MKTGRPTSEGRIIFKHAELVTNNCYLSWMVLSSPSARSQVQTQVVVNYHGILRKIKKEEEELIKKQVHSITKSNQTTLVDK